MDCNGDYVESRPGVSNAQSMEDGVLRGDERCFKQVSPPRVGGSRNTSPMGRAGSRNTSPSRQKVIKTKPRGLDEETLATFGKAVHTDVQMEDNIWAMLPEDLLYEILARVPPFIIFRLRSVCKRWYSLLQDSSFLQFHSRVPSHGPCLLTFWKNSQTPQCSVFSLPLKTWYRIPFTFLPHWAFWLVGSSGGLVCFSGLDGLTFRTLVCNPLTQTWRTLPSMHYNQQRQLIMVVDRVDRSFKLIATSDIYGDKSLPTEVYDSKLDSWSVHQIMPAVNLCSSKMAYCDSRLYLETLSPLGLMMYRIDTGHWEHIPAKFPRSLLDGYLVAGTQKRLFLVGRIGLYSTLQSMRIWELDHAKIVWVELSRMPPKYFRTLLRLSAERFECFGQDNLICFTSWNQGKGLLFDVDKKVWSWIGGFALQSYNSQGIEAPSCSWNLTSNGQFNVKSFYNFCQSLDWQDTAVNWLNIWKLPGAQRVKTFMWLLVEGRLVTNTERYRRKMALDYECLFCHSPAESIDHIFQGMLSSC